MFKVFENFQSTAKSIPTDGSMHKYSACHIRRRYHVSIFLQIGVKITLTFCCSTLWSFTIIYIDLFHHMYFLLLWQSYHIPYILCSPLWIKQRKNRLPQLWCVQDASYTTRTSCFCDVISWLVALVVFPFCFAIVSRHWLVIVIVSYISLFSKPARKQTTQLYIVLHAQQDRAMHKLVTGIK